MANCEFSEFSFGYAITHSLSAAVGLVGRAPVFPSLIQEGSAGGGYDVKLPLAPFPIFLQFKIPQVLSRSSSLRPAAYGLPYYRMHLRTKRPNQHQLLLDLEATEPLVFYTAPLFETLADLDTHFTRKVVHEHSAYVRPSDIGPLDAKRHHVSYYPTAATYWLHSEPIALKGSFSFSDFAKRISVHVQQLRKSQGLVGRNVHEGEANERRQKVFGELQSIFAKLDEKYVEGVTRKLPRDTAARRAIHKIEISPSAETARRLAYVSQVRFDTILAFGELAENANT